MRNECLPVVHHVGRQVHGQLLMMIGTNDPGLVQCAECREFHVREFGARVRRRPESFVPVGWRQLGPWRGEMTQCGQGTTAQGTGIVGLQPGGQAVRVIHMGAGESDGSGCNDFIANDAVLDGGGVTRRAGCAIMYGHQGQILQHDGCGGSLGSADGVLAVEDRESLHCIRGEMRRRG
jgi:hypothetical protein